MKKTQCVLCRTCANSKARGSGRERRRHERVCGAGLREADDLFECESYIAAPLPVPAARRTPADGVPHPRSN